MPTRLQRSSQLIVERLTRFEQTQRAAFESGNKPSQDALRAIFRTIVTNPDLVMGGQQKAQFISLYGAPMWAYQQGLYFSWLRRQEGA